MPKEQQGNWQVTAASHIFDVKLADILLPRETLSDEQYEARERFLYMIPNLPLKKHSGPNGNVGGPGSDLYLDYEIIKALKTGEPLSDAAFDRVKLKVALLKGFGLDKGLNEDSLKKLFVLGSLINEKGTSVDELYPVFYEKGKPVNIWKDEPQKNTGLKNNGEPSLSTKKGRERVANHKTFEQDTGQKKDHSPSKRTQKGIEFGIPKSELPARLSGLRKDGKTPDLRTILGKQIAANRAFAQVPISLAYNVRLN
jgi:hypothetical protein